MDAARVRGTIIAMLNAGEEEINAMHVAAGLIESHQAPASQVGFDASDMIVRRAAFDACWELVREGILRPGSPRPTPGPAQDGMFAVTLAAAARLPLA